MDSAHPFDDGVTPADARRRTLDVLEARLDKLAPAALVKNDGDRVEVMLPYGARPEPIARMLTRSGRIELKLVDDGSDYMKQVVALISPRAPELGVTTADDRWTEKDSAAPHSDVYLRSDDLGKLTSAWAAVTEKDLPLPRDHSIAYEARTLENGETGWRSYYLFSRAEVDGDRIGEVEQVWDERTRWPEVLLAFDREGAAKFEALTARAIGRKLAILLEGRVNSAPVIEGKISGGRARITMGGGGDREQLENEAKELVAILGAGSTSARVTLLETRQPSP